MKERKVITVLIIIILILMCIIYNLINKGNVNSKKQIIKEMTENEQVTNLQAQINNLQASHTEFANHIEESKKKIANAITDMGIETSNKDTFETMESNIRKLSQIFSTNYTDIPFEVVATYKGTDRTPSVTANIDIDNGLLLAVTTTETGTYKETTWSSDGNASLELLYDEGTAPKLCVFKVNNLKANETLNITSYYIRSACLTLIKLPQDVVSTIAYETTENDHFISYTFTDKFEKGIVFAGYSSDVTGYEYHDKLYTTCGRTKLIQALSNGAGSYGGAPGAIVATISNLEAGNTTMAFRQYARAQRMVILKIE